MFCKKLLLILEDSLGDEKTQKLYEFCKYLTKRCLGLNVIGFISSFLFLLEMNHCIRIIVDFNVLDNPEFLATKRPYSFTPPNSYNEDLNHETAAAFYQNSQCSSKIASNYSGNNTQHHEYDEYKKKLKLDTKFESKCQQSKYSATSFHTSNYLNSKTTTIESNIEHLMFHNIGNNEDLDCTKNQGAKNTLVHQKSNNLVTFDYLQTFKIRSKYFDELAKTENEQIRLNIKDITKSNVDSHIFEECINVLKNGWNLDFLSIKEEEFLIIIWLLYDLICYAESNALFILYKNLLPFIFLYLTDASFFDELNFFNVDFVNHYKYFLPFIYVLYDTIHVTYNSIVKELVFIEKEQVTTDISLETHDIDEIIIRITPRALELILNENFEKKLIILNHIVCSYRIKGIRISKDNIFFTEIKDLDFACNPVHENTSLKMQTSFAVVFKNINSIDKNKITSIEFERIIISDIDFSFCMALRNLKSLILVHCDGEKSNIFFRSLSKNFPELRALRIIGFILKNGFFNNLSLESLNFLDLSCCEYKSDLKFYKCPEIKYLQEFHINYSKMNYKIINSIMLSAELKVLSMRGVDFYRLKYFENCDNWKDTFEYLDLSRCMWNNFFLDFFSANIIAEILILDHLCGITHLKRILSQKSLQRSTKKLSLSGSLVDAELLFFISGFGILESLNISALEENTNTSLNSNHNYLNNLVSPNPTRNKLENASLSFINQFNRLAELDISDVCLKAGFMAYICLPCLIISLIKIDISGNLLCPYDIFQIGLLINLRHLVIFLDNEVFSEFLKIHGNLRCLNLETLILCSTIINKDVKNLIISQPLLKNVELRKCIIEPNIFRINCSSKAIFFENKTFIVSGEWLDFNHS
ncbi:hypothetical protein CWI36_0132p0020 [Hamiltosporidium magnivora]|uniref:Uncharacterized protein n=1 Tax=Hamiltosporidium magnivora TaxID=148818 RepID=A0A4Q9LJU1_9MICR|nr:hypothetical protein CWI36_0132p0020 [Hamiltosporidium magnivora]